MFPTETAVPATFAEYMTLHNVPADHPNLDGYRVMWERALYVETSVPKVIPPCPSWCQSPDGHEYDSTDGYDETLTYIRSHMAMERPHLWVDAWEHNCAGVVTMQAPSICTPDQGDLDSSQARAYAAELLEAADLLDRITATTTAPQ